MNKRYISPVTEIVVVRCTTAILQSSIEVHSEKVEDVEDIGFAKEERREDGNRYSVDWYKGEGWE